MIGVHDLMLVGFGLGYQELLILLAIILLLFGSSKLPALMRSMGQGVNEFKRGMNAPADEPSESETPENH